MLVCLLFADMVELADTPDLGSGAVRHTGSSPAIRTTRLSLDAIRVPGSAFSFALPLAFSAGISFVA